MSDQSKLEIGAIQWADLTCHNAPQVRDFYAAVAGWKADALGMGGYDDFCMTNPSTGKTVAGICHARGDNAALPPLWLVYINVADIEAGVAQVNAHGGRLLTPIREMGGGKMAVIRDPAGAVAALYQPPA